MTYHRLRVTTWLSLVIVVLAACSGGQGRATRGARSSEEFMTTLRTMLQAAQTEEAPTP